MFSKFQFARTTSPRLLVHILSWLACMALSYAITPAAQACDEAGATCSLPGAPVSLPSSGPVQLGANNPINITNGNKYQREVDMAPLPGVLGLEIVRHYNSVLSGTNRWPYAIGRGWRLSYETQLSATPYNVEITQADGSVLHFSRDPLRPDIARTLDPSQGIVAIVRGRQGDAYVWTWVDGRRLSFDDRGLLQQVQAPTGEILSMQYDAHGALMRVTDPQGRSLHLVWLDSDTARKRDRFRGVQHIDSPVGRFDYEHGSPVPAGSKANAAALLANLVRVGYPASAGAAATGRRYHYEDPVHPTLLTGISIEARAVASAVPANDAGAPIVTRYATYAYGPDGRAVYSSHAGNVGAVKLSFKPGQTTVTNSLGGTTLFRHGVIADAYRILEVRGERCTGCAEPNMRYAYDNLGRLLDSTRIDGAGIPLETTRTTLDYYGRPVQVQKIGYVNGAAQAPQLVVRYEYGAGNSMTPTLIAKPSVVPGKEQVTRIRYNAAGQRTSVTDSGWTPPAGSGQAATPITRTTTYTYRSINGRSLLSQIDGPLANGKTASPLDSDITRIEYDRRGNYITKVIAPGMQTTTVSAIDDIGRPAIIVTPDGVETRVEYDREGHPTKVVKAGVTQSYAYAALGGLQTIQNATGERINFEYAASGQLTAIADAQKNRIQLQWNSEDELVSRTLLNPDGTLAQESALSRFVPQARTDGQVGAAVVGLAMQGVDASGLMAGRDTHAPSGIDLAFDAAGRLSSVQDSRKKQTGYVYDDFGRVVSITSPDSGVTRFAWDAADHLLQKTVGWGSADASTVSYRYDAAGRVVEQTTREGVTRIVYGAQGRPTSITYPGGQELFSYDAATRLTGHTRVIDELRFTTLYRYDKLGQLVEKTLPDGEVLAYLYNGAMHAKPGLLASISRRDLFGKTTLLTGLNDAADGYADERYQLANGVDYVRQLDRFGQIRRIGSAGVWEENQVRTVDGLLQRRDVSTVGQLQTIGISYDGMGRLQGIGQAGTRGKQDARGYAYDPAGNLLSQIIGKERTIYRVAGDSNRLLAAEHGGDVKYYRYNGAGSVTELGDTTYTWDSQQRLVKVTTAGKPVAEYAYNAFGERIRKISYAGNQKKVVYYFYDGAELVAEAEPDKGSIEITRQYVWLEEYGLTRPIAMLQHKSDSAGAALGVIPTELTRSAGQARQTDVFAIVADHTGAPRALVNEQRQTVWRADVNGFGDMTVSAVSKLTLNLRGSSQYFDAETGLHYNRHRYLDVESGRYLSADPSGQQGGVNLYAFAENNPVDNVDPLGLEAKPASAVSTWSMQDKLKYVFPKVASKFPGEIGKVLLDMVSPKALATTAGIFALWAGAQLTPYGWAADIAAYGIGALFMGEAAWDVLKGLRDASLLIINAKCTGDLNKASDILAQNIATAVAIYGVTKGTPKVAKLLKRMLKKPVKQAPVPDKEAPVPDKKSAMQENALENTVEKNSTGLPVLGVLDEAVFAQVPAKPTKAFSEEGQKIYSKAAGKLIKTVSDLTEALKEGLIQPNQIPLDYVMMDGKRVIANTRSSTALINAGIPKNKWYGIDKTGVTAYGEVTFDDLVRNQLNKNYGGSVDKARK